MSRQPSLPPEYWAKAPELEGVRSFLRWLIRLDDARDPQGVEDRRTVTLNQIIIYARSLEPRLDKGQAALVACELDQLAYEMDERPANPSVTAEDVRARAAQLRGEDTWCNCQAIRGTANYPGPWHPKGDSVGCLKYGADALSAQQETP